MHDRPIVILQHHKSLCLSLAAQLPTLVTSGIATEPHCTEENLVYAITTLCSTQITTIKATVWLSLGWNIELPLFPNHKLEAQSGPD